MRLLALLLAFVLLAGCGGQDEPARARPEPAPQARSDDPPPANGPTALAGRVRIEGDPPARSVLDVGSCMPGVETLDESVVVNPDGTLRNVVVWIAEGAGAAETPGPPDPVRLDQKGGAFVPHVLAVRVGQKVLVVNSDPVRHNVRLTAFLNASGTVMQSPGPEPTERVFDQPELPIQIVCDIHRWMKCHAAVFDHPWFAVTGDGGTFRFEGLPPGKYRLETWHEVWSEPKTLEVEVVAGKTSEVEFVYRASGG